MMILVLAAVLTAGTPHLKDYTRDPIGLYDQGGLLVRKAPRKELPKPPFDVVTTQGFVSFEMNGVRVYLRNSDVIVEGGQRVACERPLTVAQSASRHTAASNIGVKSGMGDADLPCIPSSR